MEQAHNRACDQENDPDQEREQGLDRVPTRLACDSDRDQENGEKHRAHHLPMPPNGGFVMKLTIKVANF